jgi:hypothetical protein
MTHPAGIIQNMRRFTASMPFVRPTPTTAPTIAWDVDTGMPSCVNRWVVIAVAIAATRAVIESRAVICLPTR